jgi:hypothetical protein
MKKSRLLIIGLILLSFNTKILGQEDTVTIENSTEPINQSDFKQKRKYKYLDNNYREEKTLLKIEIPPMNYIYTSYEILNLFNNIDINIGLEQKMGKSFSLVFDNNFFYVHPSPYMEWGWSNDIGFRYYYSMNKRIRESLGANNFHSNYLSIKMEEWIKYGFDNDHLSFDPYLNISWGMQRRIGKIGIVDVGTYFKYRSKDYEIGLNLLIGLAWGFKK